VYREDFSPEALEAFDRYCASATSVFVAPRTEAAPENAGRDFLTSPVIL